MVDFVVKISNNAKLEMKKGASARADTRFINAMNRITI